MRRDLLVALLLALALVGMAMVGCGGNIKGNGPDGAAQPGACGSLSECECYAAGDRCAMVTESCWCPSVCDSKIVCVCGGGRFLGCQDSAGVTACNAQLARVQSLCAAQPFVGSLSGVCGTTPSCIAGCLSQLNTADACTQIDCSFCLQCDCLSPSMPSQLHTCINECNGAGPIPN